jgi:hypothetical protein
VLLSYAIWKENDVPTAYTPKLNKVIVTVARFVTEQCSVVQEGNLKN